MDTSQRRHFTVRPTNDGAWTYHPQPPLPEITAFLVDWWTSIGRLREEYDAVDHFTTKQDYDRFTAQFGEPHTS